MAAAEGDHKGRALRQCEGGSRTAPTRWSTDGRLGVEIEIPESIRDQLAASP